MGSLGSIQGKPKLVQAEAMQSCRYTEPRWNLQVEPAVAITVYALLLLNRGHPTQQLSSSLLSFCCMHGNRYSESPATMLLRYL